MPIALVTGATGILGREIVAELSKDEKTWPTIYALSHSKTHGYASNVKQQHIDLLAPPQDLAKQLAGINPDIIFYTAYLAKDSEEEATKVNGDMLENLLEALHITGASRLVRRVILTTGAKQYGVHLGVPKNPMEEKDRWLTESDRPPNFYYRQQQILAQKGKEQEWDWVVTYPNDVIGVAQGNFMNLTTALGIYCAVTKELKQELVWPGSPAFYMAFDCLTSSNLHARFNLWAALNQGPQISNQAFNVVNGDVESWSNMWPRLAAKFGMRIPTQMFSSEEQNGVVDEKIGYKTQLMQRPPLSEFAAERGLVNSSWLKPSFVENKIDLVQWSQRDDVRAAWAKMAQREKLDSSAFDKATWKFLSFVLGRNFDMIISMNKARKAGWTGFQDTFDSLDECLDQLVTERILPSFRPKRESLNRSNSDIITLGRLRGRDVEK